VDYPKSVPSVGLVDGKFVDENQASGTPGSLIPAQWGNAVTQEILNVIAGGGLPPDEQSNTQLLAAIKKVILQGGVSPGRLLATRLFEANGIYTPTPGTAFVIVEGIGGGGAGGGGPVTSSGNVGGGAGGNGGAYGKALFSIAQIGASQAVTIGAGGIGTTGGGGNGGSTSLGSLLSLPGGAGAFSFGNAGPPLNSGNGADRCEPSFWCWPYFDCCIHFLSQHWSERAGSKHFVWFRRRRYQHHWPWDQRVRVWCRRRWGVGDVR
jgi:hypothetical protein